LKVSLLHRAYTVSQVVKIVVSLTNKSSHTCGAPGAPGGGATPFGLGVCGTTPLIIVNAAKQPVYPDDIGVSCLSFSGPRLSGHQSASATATWDQRALIPDSKTTKLVQRGTYRVEVGPVSMPITLANAPVSDALTHEAHVAFENCRARTTILKATLPKLTYAVGQSVPIEVTLSNTSDIPCGDAGPSFSGGSAHQLSIGECGQISLQVNTVNGENIFPGTAIFGCPMISGVRLPAHGSLRASNTWTESAYPQTPANGAVVPHQAPAGAYRLTLQNAVTFPLTLDAGTNGVG
jgi:hypothetical protein